MMKMSLSGQRMRWHRCRSEIVVLFLVMRKRCHGMTIALQNSREIVSMGGWRKLHCEGRCMIVGISSAKNKAFGGM